MSWRKTGYASPRARSPEPTKDTDELQSYRRFYQNRRRLGIVGRITVIHSVFRKLPRSPMNCDVGLSHNAFGLPNLQPGRGICAFQQMP